MKIGILTFSDFNTNYGSMLQAYALNVFLEKQGHEVYFIKYREFNQTSKSAGLINGVINNLKKIYFYFQKKYREKDISKTVENFEIFKRKLKYTDLYISNDDLKSISDEFDCFISGSDQIWNISCLGGLRKAYFLDFVEESKLKIAYAASAGEYKFKKEDYGVISRLLENIDYISVRENEMIANLQCFTDKNIYNVIDPTFLLSKSDWEEIIPKSPLKEKYAVCYFVRRSKFGKHIVKKLSKRYEMPIYNLSDNNIYINGTNSKLISSGPLEFLGLINGASYCVGTSFHLAAFSIIFEKPFVIIGSEHNRDRINNILRLTGQEKNFLTPLDDVQSILDCIFEQKQNKKCLIDKIEFSKHFLANAINDLEVK